MAWNYAELSKAAKENGGPEKLVEMLIDSGKKSMVPWLGVALASGVGLTIGIQKIMQYLKEKSLQSKRAVEAAKAELIKGINDYDAAHPTPEGELLNPDGLAVDENGGDQNGKTTGT